MERIELYVPETKKKTLWKLNLVDIQWRYGLKQQQSNESASYEMSEPIT